VAITSLNMLAVLRAEFDDREPGVFLVDFAAGRAYGLDGSEVSGEVQESIMSGIRDQQEASMPDIPYEQIYDVMDTERKMQEENNKHIFRRGE
jgi:hypothetical protein